MVFLERQFWTDALQRLTQGIMEWLPDLVAGIVLIAAGWMIAHICRAILAGGLKRIGVDRLAQRLGIDEGLKKSGIESPLAELLARVAYWIIFLLFIMAAVEVLGLRGVTDTLGILVAYLPRVLAAALILLLGVLTARIVGNALGALALQSGIRGGAVLGQVTRYVLLAFVLILAMEQLGIETTLLINTASTLVAAAALALAVAFGWGSRELARNIMAGFHAREEFIVGQLLSLRGYTGRLVHIGSTRCVLETEEGRLSLPNSALTDEEVMILTESEEEQI
jgi:hypothetical protein